MASISSDEPAGYALRVADDSYTWYRGAAIKARRHYRLSEILQLLISAAIPVSAVMNPNDAKAPAILGAILVVLTGLKSIFHWQDDYLRFSAAREAVEAERRLYLTGAEPYADLSTKDQTLAAAVTRIERQEMEVWTKIAAKQPESKDRNE
ncbi:DUF4231 domain-containing protein [Nonomuraea sp. NN258]|uniref:DUF4231 domain-containing protein n=1 Tax=Nonomuraea antri TaxID=2730852 RepID=UPI00156A4FDF|nr:DUF4231 domain-containing protein [Nonomuraea antri]NRQ36300.1 DUF4231 domain-containing protein [Nonomuraea antri]